MERGLQLQVAVTGKSDCDSVAVKRSVYAIAMSRAMSTATPAEISAEEWDALVAVWLNPPPVENP